MWEGGRGGERKQLMWRPLFIFSLLLCLCTLSLLRLLPGVYLNSTRFFFLSYDSMRGGVAILRSTQSRTVGLLVVTRCQIKHLQIMTRFFSGINAVLVFSGDGGPLCGEDFHVMAMTPEDSAKRKKT